MNISIFGLGYVGCVSLGCLAKNGFNVIGVDINQNKIDLINSGKPTIIEKDIDGIIAEAFSEGKVSATKEYSDAVMQSSVSIICVGTPSTKEGHLNLDYIYQTAKEIGEALRHKNSFHVVAIRSTVLPGTNSEVSRIIEKTSGKKVNHDFGVVSNPEFLREGSAVSDYYNPAVTVLGGEDAKSLKIMASIYKDVNAPIQTVEVKEAELIKYINNAFHALKITFANEVGNICKKLSIDSHKVMELFGMDDKLNISTYYFKPGFAYGGSCLPKDLKGLKTLAHDNYLSSPVIESIEKSNSIQKNNAIDLINNLGSKNVGILGLSFKAGTDDLRYSPIVEVSEYFLGKGYKLKIYDRNVKLSRLTGTNKDFIEEHIPHLADLITDDVDEVIQSSDIIVINHKLKEFTGIVEKYPNKRFIDLARIIDQKSEGNYEGICW